MPKQGVVLAFLGFGEQVTQDATRFLLHSGLFLKRRGHLGWTHRAAALFPFLLHFCEDILEELHDV